MPYSDDASQQRDDSADTQATQAYNPFAETMAGEEMPIAATSVPAPATTQQVSGLPHTPVAQSMPAPASVPAAPTPDPISSSFPMPTQQVPAPSNAQPTQPMQEAPTQAMPPLPQQSIPTQQFAAAQTTQATQPLQSSQATQPTQPTQPLQDMAMQQLDDPYAGRRMATQSMNFSSRPSVLPRSASEDALMGATGVVGAPIGSAQARDAAETQVMQPTVSVPPTMPMTAGQTQTIAYGQNPYAAVAPTPDADAADAATMAYGGRIPRSAQSARMSSTATPGYAGDEDSVSMESAPAYGTQTFGTMPPVSADATGYGQQSVAANRQGSNPSDEFTAIVGSDDSSSHSSHRDEGSSSTGKTARVIAIIVVVVLVIVGIAVALSRKSKSNPGQVASSSANATTSLASCQESVNRYNDSRNRWNSVVSEASATSAITADQVQDASTVANLQLALKATVPDLTQCDTSATDTQLQQTTSLNNDAADTLQKNADAVTAAAQKVTDSKSAKDSADASASAEASQQQQQEEAQQLAQAQTDLKTAIDAANAQLSEAQQRLGPTDPNVQQFQQEIAASQQVLNNSSADYATVTGSTNTLTSATSYMKRQVDSATVSAAPDTNPQPQPSEQTQQDQQTQSDQGSESNQQESANQGQ
ncbi:hypothetical protein [Pseudoscardovia suis]|uniref:Sugar-binding protein n=1 Tax=Pseudoscardovia suis TaxID=987063 RepID=A0A261EWE3_9BIFI|nr:hypothetical protein [Pseudoscardovia suis]OZG51171.1 hypothetical protein PSSU_1108 [Pseudoscardovia suis]PJJ65963.1 hypothetical protein CLV65_1215 [Pseudoscardovia suis]